MGRLWLTIVLILTAAPGCDNVTWGGSSVALRRPPSRAELAAGRPPEPVLPEVAEEPETPVPPVLFAGSRDGARARLVAIGELRGGELSPLPWDPATRGFGEALTRTHLAPGTELVLFSEGARVGRLTVDDAGTDASYCAPRPTVSGVLELVPSASQASRFLALPAREARGRPFDAFTPLEHNFDQRVASLDLARQALPSVGATWPPSVLAARKDIRVFRLVEGSGLSIVATFLYGDSLAISPPVPGGYSMFLMGIERDGGIEREYLWYRRVNTEGKGAPRYFDHLDWNGDGSEELLLDVFGAESRWFAGLSQRSGSWVRTFEDPCGVATQGR